jgi:DNA-binding NarL/FixJ family response regulator
LDVTLKTVETHVASVYAKLGVSSGDGNPRVLAILAWLRARSE